MSETACYVIHKQKAVYYIFRKESDSGGGYSIIRVELYQVRRGILGGEDKGEVQILLLFKYRQKQFILTSNHLL